MDVVKGSVYLTEHWYRRPPKTPWSQQHKKTEAKAGQLRLVRRGTSLRYLVSDGPGQDFREIWYQKNFGAEDLEFLKLSVTDSGEPGNPVDARLVDLRVRMGPSLADNAFTPAPLAEPAPAAEVPLVPASPEGKSRPSRTLLVVLLLGLGLTLLVGVSLAAWYFLRRQHDSAKLPEKDSVEEPGAAQATVLLACSNCGKKLKVKTEVAGKKVKCPQCGQAVLTSER
jgi:DNA-directed RNA polymerase subunit RPC12/RpoP